MVTLADRLGFRVALELVDDLAGMLFGLLGDVGVVDGSLHNDGRLDHHREEQRVADIPCGLQSGGWGETCWFEGGGTKDGVCGG